MTLTTSLSLADLPVATLTQQARCNIACYLADRQPNEDPSTFELFRRAIVESDQDAWTALYDLYQFLVRNWIANRLAGDVSADACEALTNDAFVKFFRAIDAKRFEGFDSILGLLAYLRTCARSVAADYRRSQRTRQVEEPAEYLDHEVVLADPAEEVMAHLFASEVWEVIGTSVNEQERLVLQVTCVLGWPARTLQRLSPAQFPTVDDVYRIRRNVLERLRRNRRLQALWFSEKKALSVSSFESTRRKE